MMVTRFRARRADNGHWVYGDYFKTPLTQENSDTQPDAGWFFLVGPRLHCIGQDGVAFVIDEKTLGQFCGLRDKNGVEIYEGDLVVSEFSQEKPYEIKWSGEHCRYYGRNKIGYQWFLDDHSALTVEVVGNVWANPDLLK